MVRAEKLKSLIRGDGVEYPASKQEAKEVESKEDSLTALEAFEVIFWPAYPRRVAKHDAFKAWQSLRLKDDDQKSLDLIMDGLERARSHWAEHDPKFIPYPGTWLRGRRWEDEE